MEKLNKSDLKTALRYAGFQKNRYWKLQQEKQSELNNLLNRFSSLNEDTLTKVQLRDLINLSCEYMKAHNLYVYYKEDYQRIYFKLNVGDNNGAVNDENSQD